MARPLTQIGRNLSEHRIAAYECAVGASAVIKKKWVVGWYGIFDEKRLKEELMPKIAQYVQMSSVSYPLLVVSYTLEGKTDVSIEGNPKRACAGDVKFKPRRRRSSHQDEAIVHSKATYQLLREP